MAFEADLRGLGVACRIDHRKRALTVADEHPLPLRIDAHIVGILAELFATRGTTAHIPSQSNVRVVRTVDLERYRQRNLVERFFNKLKHLRRIATRYDKLARNFLAAVALASIRIAIRHYESTT